MSNLTNIQRDAFWSTLKEADELSWGSDRLIASQTMYINADATIYDDIGKARNDHTSVLVIAAGSYRGFGLFMQQTGDDDTPYRVKMYSNTANFIAHLGIGYGPASPTGTDDEISEIAFFTPIYGAIDDIFILPKLDSGDTYYARPVAFGVFASFNGGIVPHCGLSVQRLATTPPTFSTAVS